MLGAAVACAALVGLLLLLLRGDFQLDSLLSTSLPIRHRYDPSLEGVLLVYLLPASVGLLGGTLLRLHGSASWAALYAFSLLGGLAYAAPFLLATEAQRASSGDAALEALEYLVLLPTLLMAGALAAQLGRPLEALPPPAHETPHEPRPVSARAPSGEGSMGGRHWRWRWPDPSVATAVAFALLGATLAAVQPLRYDVPQGADTYVQLAAAEALHRGLPFTADPHFAGQSNSFYPPGAEAATTALSEATGVPLVTVWQVVPVVTAPLLLAAVLVPLARRGVPPALLVATGGLLLAWHQVLFVDVAARHLSFAIGATGFAVLLGEGPWRRALGGGLVAASALFHFSLATVALGATVVALAAGAWARWRSRQAAARPRSPRRQPPVLPWAGTPGAVLVAAIGAPLVVAAFLSSRLASFGPAGVHTISEVALGATLPYGFVSMVAGPVLLAAPAVALSRATAPRLRLVAAVACIGGLALAYFTLAWAVYHRYFVELAFVGVLLLAALLLAATVRSAGLQRTACVLVVLAVATALVPRQDRIGTLSEDVEGRLELRAGLLDAIAGLPEDAVVLAAPDDIVNRYIPGVAGRLIYCASIEEGAGFQVVSKPLRLVPVIHARNVLAEAFYDDPGNDTLAPIQEDERVHAIVFDADRHPRSVVAAVGGAEAYRDDEFFLVVLP